MHSRFVTARVSDAGEKLARNKPTTLLWSVDQKKNDLVSVCKRKKAHLNAEIMKRRTSCERHVQTLTSSSGSRTNNTCRRNLTKAVIIGRPPGLRCTDGADDCGATQVGGVRRGVGRLLTRRHAEDVVEKTCVKDQPSVGGRQRRRLTSTQRRRFMGPLSELCVFVAL